MIFPEPPTNIRELTRVSNFHALPTGLMRPYLGPQYDHDKIWGLQEEPDDENYDYYGLVRAFDVLPLLGTSFKISQDSQLSSGLLELLKIKLPGIGWQNIEVSPYPLRKYFIIDTSFPAPIDETTKTPMAISIFGNVVSLEADSTLYEYKYWNAFKTGNSYNAFELQSALGENKNGWPNWLEKELIAIMEIKISEAVYANKLHVLEKCYI